MTFDPSEHPELAIMLQVVQEQIDALPPDEKRSVEVEVAKANADPASHVEFLGWDLDRDATGLRLAGATFWIPMDRLPKRDDEGTLET